MAASDQGAAVEYVSDLGPPGGGGLMLAERSRHKSITQFLAWEIAWRSIIGSASELVVLFGNAELRRLLRQRFDVRREVESFAGRAYAAAELWEAAPRGRRGRPWRLARSHGTRHRLKNRCARAETCVRPCVPAIMSP
jgi:hypothetical protein